MNSKVKTILTSSTLLLLISCFLVYGLYKSRNILSGPQITIDSPTPSASLSDQLIAVKGKAQNVAAVFLNGNQIFTDQNGNFDESLLLAKGYNVVELKANDKFGRDVKQTRELYVKN